MKSGMTRRQLAGSLLAAAAVAQAPPETARPAPGAPADDLEAARDQNRRSAEALAQVAVPMDTEPAFHFSA
jgi:hypothetical protein